MADVKGWDDAAPVRAWDDAPTKGWDDTPQESSLGMNDVADFFANLPAGVIRGGQQGVRGATQLAAAIPGMPRDAMLKYTDEAAQSTDRFIEENFPSQSKGAQLGQGIGNLPAMVNPLTAIPTAVGALTDLQRTLHDRGVDPETAATAAKIQGVSGAATGALPFANATRLAAAGTNVATGAGADYATREFLKSKGYGKIAEELFNPTDVVARVTDVVGGAAAGVPSKAPVRTIPEVRGKLDALDKAKEETARTQGEGTIYVGKDKEASKDLAVRIEETPEQLDRVRTIQQNQLEESTRTPEPVQRDMFPAEPEQQSLDLRTEETPPAETSASFDSALNDTYDALQQHPEPKDVPSFQAALQTIKDTLLKKGTVERADVRKAVEREQTRRTNWFDDVKNRVTLAAKLVKPDGSMDLVETLRSIAEDPMSSAFRGPLVNLLQRLAPYIHDVKLRAEMDPRDPTKMIPSRPDGSIGVYNSVTHTVSLTAQGFTVRTLAHELVHAATVRALNQFVDGITGKVRSEAPAFVHGLNKIMEHMRSKSVKTTNSEGKDSYHYEGGKLYGLSDVKEFVSEVMTNKYLQEHLRKMAVSEVKGLSDGLGSTVKNMLQAFKALVHRALGSETPAEQTLLDRAIDLVNENIQYQSENSAKINNYYKTLFRNRPDLRELTGADQSKFESQMRSSISDEETTRADTVSKLTGTDYIPKDPEITPQLIEKIQGEKDGSKWWAMTPGALARSELAKSTLVKTVYRLMDNAFKRADYFNKNVIQPVEKSISHLLNSGEQGQILHEIMTRELKNGKDYTPDELRAIGISDRVIMAHLEFRAMMQDVLEKQNAILRSKGLKEVTGIDAYLSSRWSGPWRANIRDAEGNIVWQVAEQSRGAAKRAIEHIKAKEPKLVYDEVTYKKGRERGDAVEAGYLDMLKMLDKDDPRIQSLESIYRDYVLGKTENVASQEKHFMRKSGVRGYAGDRPWAKNDVKDMFFQQFEYAKNAVRWAESQSPMDKVDLLLKNPKLQDSQKNNIEYSKEYTKNQLGFGTHELFANIDNYVAKALGVSPATLQTAMGASKTYFYLTRLGMSVPFMLSQLYQVAVSTPAWHGQLTSEGYKHSAINTSVLGFLHGVPSAAWHYSNMLGLPTEHILSGMDSVEKEALKYMEANGVIDINPMSDIQRDTQNRIIKAAKFPFELAIQMPEVIGRSMAFMSYLQHLRASGKFDEKTLQGRMDMFQKAEDLTKISMTDYRRQERALAFQRAGLTGDAAATLHSYMVNNLAQLTKFSKEALNGNPAPLFYMVAAQAIAGGLAGLWFVEDVDDFLDNLKKFLPHDLYKKVQNFSLKNFILDNFGEVGAYGLVSKATGSNIHTRMGAGNIIPIWPFETDQVSDQVGKMAPFVGVTGSGLGAVATMADPTATAQDKWQAVYKAAPAVAQGPMESLPAFNAGDVSLTPSNLKMGQRRRTEEEKTLRNYGFRSTAEQEEKDRNFSLSKIERQLQDRLKGANERSIENFLSKDNKGGVTELIKYVELGGEPDTILNRLPAAQLNQVTTELDRRAIDAGKGTKASILKLKRYLDTR